MALCGSSLSKLIHVGSAVSCQCLDALYPFHRAGNGCTEVYSTWQAGAQSPPRPARPHLPLSAECVCDSQNDNRLPGPGPCLPREGGIGTALELVAQLYTSQFPGGFALCSPEDGDITHSPRGRRWHTPCFPTAGTGDAQRGHRLPGLCPRAPMCSLPWGDDGGLDTVMATACPQEGGGYGGHGPRGPGGSQAGPLFRTPGLTRQGAALCLKVSEVVT